MDLLQASLSQPPVSSSFLIVPLSLTRETPQSESTMVPLSLTFNYCCLPLVTALARQAVKTRFWINGFQSAFIHGGGYRNSALVNHVVCSSVRHASIIQSAHLLNQAVSRECKKIRL